MSERRAHWDDSLIDAMTAVMRRHYEGGDDEDTYDAIAIVEDWEAQRGYVSSSVYHGHVDYLQSTIQRVRELHHPISLIADVCVWCGVPVPCPTIRALDGES